MALSNLVHYLTLVGRMAAGFAIGGAAIATASAQTAAEPAAAPAAAPAKPVPVTLSGPPQKMPDTGYIILSRDVGPRNALTPEVGVRHTVATVPDPALLAFATEVSAITDGEAANISGNINVVTSVGPNVENALAAVGLGESGLGRENTALGSSGGVGGTVSGSIASGMAALGTALGTLTTGGQ